jgi:DnaJ like chaperone protein
MNMDYSQRLQLVSFLVTIAQADGSVVQAEIQALRDVAASLGISAADVESMLNLRSGKNDLEAAYKVLGISPSATDDEVKAAYRQMALKHHPDRVAKLGEDVRKAAEKKFQEINDAKDKIYKARGL